MIYRSVYDICLYFYIILFSIHGIFQSVKNIYYIYLNEQTNIKPKKKTVFYSKFPFMHLFVLAATDKTYDHMHFFL